MNIFDKLFKRKPYSFDFAPIIVPVKPLYRVLVKHTKDKENIIMMFDVPVHADYNLFNSMITLRDEKGTMLYFAHMDLIEYLQVFAPDIPNEPMFLKKKMNIPKEEKS